MSFSRTRTISKPLPGSMLDPTHPLCPSHALLMNEGAGRQLIDLGSSLRPYFTGTVNWAGGPTGRSLDFGTTNGYATFPAASWQTAPAGFSVSALVYLALNEDAVPICSKDAVGAREFNLVYRSALTDVRLIIHNNAGQYIGRGGPAPLYLSWARVTATYNGGLTDAAIRLYLNGRRIDNADRGSGVFTGLTVTATPLEIARYYGGDAGGGNSWPGKIADWFWWPRCLSDVEVAAHAAEPYAASLVPPYRKYFIPAAGGAGGRVFDGSIFGGMILR